VCVPSAFQLIAPRESNPRRWLRTRWIDRYSGDSFRITTKGHHGGPGVARVQTYGEVIESYEYHPEAKFADTEGRACGKQTVGLLQRRHVKIGEVTNIGKESNSLKEVEAGVEHDEADIYNRISRPASEPLEHGSAAGGEEGSARDIGAHVQRRSLSTGAHRHSGRSAYTASQESSAAPIHRTETRSSLR
jgi:hypothetical protein